MKKKKKSPAVTVLEILVLIILLAVLAIIVFDGFEATQNLKVTPTPAPTVAPTPTPTPTPTPPPTPVIPGIADFAPHAVEGTEPDKLIVSTAVQVDGTVVEEYTAEKEIFFDLPEKYTELDGIIGFRGNNYRTGASFGTAEVKNNSLTTVWSRATSCLADSDGYNWCGSGWTGQPLIVKWPDKTRNNIKAMYDTARAKKDLVEVIYATLDGHIYFYDLATGEYTRDPMNLGFTFKGAGALDPRGYPIMYLGAGIDSVNGASRAFIVNLIDDTVMLEFGKYDDFCSRAWYAYDSSPLVCAETDQLIYPGENGVLYIMHLNTKYDEDTGELSIDPDNTIKWKYKGARTGSKYWLGIESSAVIINSYIYLADNGGNLMCLDLNTLKLVWVQDTLDDTNCTPVCDVEDGHPYIYISTSFHMGWRSSYTAPIPIMKIDAETGEVVWRTDYTCFTVADVSGGVQGTIAVGKNKLSDLIFVPVARTPEAGSGILAALNKKTGEIVWELKTGVYSWSSPVDFYDSEGNGYLAFCNSGGNLYLIDGLTGERLNYIDLGANIEASPAMYGSSVVVGTRGERTYCVKVG